MPFSLINSDMWNNYDSIINQMVERENVPISQSIESDLMTWIKTNTRMSEYIIKKQTMQWVRWVRQ